MAKTVAAASAAEAKAQGVSDREHVSPIWIDLSAGSFTSASGEGRTPVWQHLS
jgi:hypothetical protein